MAILTDAPHDKEFVFQDGSRVKNIVELVRRLEDMSDHIFNHFVNHSKNDFANWIEYVLLDKELATKIRFKHSRHEVIEILKDSIVNLYEKSSALTIGGYILHSNAVQIYHKKHDESKVSGHSENKSEKTFEDKHETKHEDKFVPEHSHKSHHNLNNSANHNLPNNSSENLHHGDISKTEPEIVSNKKSLIDTIKHKFKSHKDKKIKKKYDNLPDVSYESEHKFENKSVSEQNSKDKNKEKIFKKWFELFSKKSSEKKLVHVEAVRAENTKVEHQLKEEISSDERENTMWALLYIALISVIVILSIYVLFFK